MGIADRLYRLVLLIFFTLVVIGCCRSQNLIPNPGFEKGDCPEGHATLNQRAQIESWSSPDLGTPDYFHRCSKENAGVPENWSGMSEPNSGDAYAGIYLSKSRYQEHLQTQLLRSLEVGKIYYGRIHVKASFYAEYLPTEIALHFSEEPLRIVSVSEYDHRMVSLKIDTSEIWRNWKVLEFEYKPKGDDKYLVIGALTTTEKNQVRTDSQLGKFPNADMQDASYVYLDDIYLGVRPYSFDEKESEEVREFTLSNVDFEFNKSELRPGAYETLDTVVQIMYTERVIAKVIGKTDSIGTDEYNYQLGYERANSVANYLRGKGVSDEDLRVSSEGELFPISSNKTEAGRQRNRVVIIRLFSENKR